MLPWKQGAVSSLTVLVLLGLGFAGCGGGTVQKETPETRERKTRNVAVGFDQKTVVRTSVLHFKMRGTNRVVPDAARVIFNGRQGDFSDLETYFSGHLTREGDVGDLVVKLPVDKSLWPKLSPEDDDRFSGRIVVELYDELGVLARGSIERAEFTFQKNVAPTVSRIDVGKVHVNESVEINGGGFLRPSEGETVAIVQSGTLTRPDNSTKDLTGETITLEWTGRRDRAVFPMDPGVFGVRQSSFDAVLQFRNKTRDGRIVDGEETPQISGTLKQSYIADLTPPAGSRGQRINVNGRGFVSNNDEEGYGMLFRYVGKFVPDDPELDTQDYTGNKAFERIPSRVVSEETVIQSIWYTVTKDRRLSGLGATPGEFRGKIVPILFDESGGDQQGLPWEGTFRVLPTKQIIYLKYLPAFSKALEKYGLRNVERAIRDRIIAVIRRDYSQWHVGVREEKPDDFIDYATIELGGPDPTGTRAFGFDNSFNGVAKDTGNLYLADYLGGVNADAAKEFNSPYGGIFISSFTFFSPKLTKDNPHASKKFDEILKPFMPKLGGTPVRGTEWPGGSRRDKIERAIRMVGSVIGNTVTHEIGHSIGMTFVKGDFVRPQNVFHNEIPGPYIMDAGSERPFKERAELSGAERPSFNPSNESYLDKVLPKPN